MDTLYFCAPKTKSMFYARINPEILSTLGQDPARNLPEKPGPTYTSVSAAINLWWKNIGISIVWVPFSCRFSACYKMTCSKYSFDKYANMNL